MNFRTLSDLNRTIFSHLHELPKDIDIIAGIPRSGLLAANIIALYMNLPLTDTDSLAEGQIYSAGISREKPKWVKNIHEARKILVVDDSVASGRSLAETREKLKSSEFFSKIIFLAIYVAPESREFPDMYFEVVEFPRIFEWNYFHTKSKLNIACFDIDGVLCPDPSEEQNDDGEKYIDFIRNTPARCVPSFEIGFLITSRLEKYRSDTEYWLEKNNIRYGKLIMMGFATKEERIKSGSYAQFKAEHYKRIREADIFVESNSKLAEEIARLSGKLVFCTDTHEVYDEGIVRKVRNRIKHKFRRVISRMLPRKLKDSIKRYIHK
ncbi:MAG: hypothetical protein IJU07_08715 [Synergistaceae bacterium]|nr:hypothetical protein [Synergistaceae bacterium]